MSDFTLETQLELPLRLARAHPRADSTVSGEDSSAEGTDVIVIFPARFSSCTRFPERTV